jgi:hypothetical protein
MDMSFPDMFEEIFEKISELYGVSEPKEIRV